ncbi:MAG: fasciclin domain-containing protein [Bacteroidaceae bacterium]|nr:fasciclin domain-containing protein [Bacteroidaceae bacterium]
MVKRILYILAVLLSIVACSDEIDKSNRYTFTGETVADYLLNRSDRYSHFISLLKRAGLFSLLNTYGQYTLFLPDNEAVEKFVQEKDSIYWATKDNEIPMWTGITSPFVEDLSDSMANVIARNHLIERNYHTAEFGEGAIGKWNFNDRIITINYKVTDEHFYIMLNNSSAIISGDNDVENGVVHLIDRPIEHMRSLIVMQIAKYDFFSLFSGAISLTGFSDAVSQAMDYTYEKSDIWRDEPDRKYIKFTAFVEPDEVFHKYGIYTLEDLIAFAEKWYGTEDKGKYRSPKNALYKFVAYHFLNGEITYDKIVPSELGLGSEIYNHFNNPGYDHYNYFVTKHGKLMKVVKPLSTTEGKNIYINYSKRKIPYNFEMRNHLNVRIIELTEFTQMDSEYAEFVPAADNGIIHAIDKILIYNEDEMAGNILNERMRFDITALQHELASNNIWQNGFADIPPGYCEGIRSEQFWFYNLGWYNGDNINLLGAYDFSIKLPPVPNRTYEIRFGIYMRGKNSNPSKEYNDKFQIYFDNEICGLPISHELPVTDESIGWIADEATYDDGIENDKLLRNKGWMKAPDSYLQYSTETGTYIPARGCYTMARKIIAKKYFTEGEHWLRFRYIGELGIQEDYTNILDYIEIVPLHIVNDPTKPEDRH